MSSRPWRISKASKGFLSCAVMICRRHTFFAHLLESEDKYVKKWRSKIESYNKWNYRIFLHIFSISFDDTLSIDHKTWDKKIIATSKWLDSVCFFYKSPKIHSFKGIFQFSFHRARLPGIFFLFFLFEVNFQRVLFSERRLPGIFLHVLPLTVFCSVKKAN